MMVEDNEEDMKEKYSKIKKDKDEYYYDGINPVEL